LHNHLLDVDGLEEGWEEGALSPWELPYLGNHNAHDQGYHFALQQLLLPEQFAQFDASGMGAGTDREERTDDADGDEYHGSPQLTYPRGHQGVRVVRALDFEWFRGRLVEHFDILFKRHEIKWPKRNRTEETTVEEEH
jgi:hypothetical protein